MGRLVVSLLMFSFACVELHGQTFANQGYLDNHIWADYGTYAVDTLDHASYIVHYKTDICTDTLKDERYNSEHVLLVGGRVNKFVPYKKHSYDLQRMRGKVYATLSNLHYLFIYDAVYTDYSKGSTTFTARVGAQDYLYEEPIPDMSWSFSDGVREIEGYTCHLAECDFRGRHYLAWYCEELPMPYGPYKFGGLPGLVLCVYDSERHYEFTFSKIESVDIPITRFEYDYITSDRKTVNRLSNDFLHNPVVYEYHHKLKGGWFIDPAKYTQLRNMRYQYDILERK